MGTMQGDGTLAWWLLPVMGKRMIINACEDSCPNARPGMILTIVCTVTGGSLHFPSLGTGMCFMPRRAKPYEPMDGE